MRGFFVRGGRMKIREFLEAIEGLSPEAEISVVLLKSNGTLEEFEVLNAVDHDGNVQLTIEENDDAH
jgi:hypothetical protein